MCALGYKQTHAVQRKTDPRGQLCIRLLTASIRTCASHKSKIGGDQLVIGRLHQSKADIGARPDYVRFTSKSRPPSDVAQYLLSANKRHSQALSQAIALISAFNAR